MYSYSDVVVMIVVRFRTTYTISAYHQ